MTLSIFTTWLIRSSLPGAAQIACIMLIGVSALIALERHGRRRQGFTGIDARSNGARRHALSGARRWIAFACCLVPVLLGFIAPLLYLSYQTVLRGIHAGFDPELVRHAFSTVTLAATATALILGIGFGAAFAVRLIRRRFAQVCIVVAGLGYAVPGTVLALGLLSPLVAIDEAIGGAAKALAGINPGLLLAGSSAAVICAYVVRFLAISTGLAQAGLARIATDLDDAARAAGTRPSGLIRSIHLPLLRPALWGAALLVFVDCLKELPATLLLRPLNVETLSTYIYQFATRGNFEDGALAALLIVLVGIAPVIWMVRHADAPLPGSSAPDTPQDH
jgi:iron(III) transport system permease protein